MYRHYTLDLIDIQKKKENIVDDNLTCLTCSIIWLIKTNAAGFDRPILCLLYESVSNFNFRGMIK